MKTDVVESNGKLKMRMGPLDVRILLESELNGGIDLYRQLVVGGSNDIVVFASTAVAVMSSQ